MNLFSEFQHEKYTSQLQLCQEMPEKKHSPTDERRRNTDALHVKPDKPEWKIITGNMKICPYEILTVQTLFRVYRSCQSQRCHPFMLYTSEMNFVQCSACRICGDEGYLWLLYKCCCFFQEVRVWFEYGWRLNDCSVRQCSVKGTVHPKMKMCC